MRSKGSHEVIEVTWGHVNFEFYKDQEAAEIRQDEFIEDYLTEKEIYKRVQVGYD